jgi:hypothetical protein
MLTPTRDKNFVDGDDCMVFVSRIVLSDLIKKMDFVKPTCWESTIDSCQFPYTGETFKHVEWELMKAMSINLSLLLETSNHLWMYFSFMIVLISYSIRIINQKQISVVFSTLEKKQPKNLTNGQKKLQIRCRRKLFSYN